MITGIDHPVIVVRSLDDAVDLYRDLGFTVEFGGSHTGKGTRNALVRFPDGYLEILEVSDVTEAMAAGAGRPQMVAYLESVESGIASFALASDSLEDDVRRIRAAGMDAPDPWASSRTEPDGTVVGWKMCVPLPVVRQPWPFLIEWDPGPRPTAEAAHPNGATGIAAVAVAVPDLEAAVVGYEQLVGSAAGPAEAIAGLDAFGRTVAVGPHEVILVAPRIPGSGPVGELLAAEGPGPFRIVVSLSDPAGIERRATALGRRLEPAWPAGRSLPGAPAAAMIAFALAVRAPPDDPG